MTTNEPPSPHVYIAVRPADLLVQPSNLSRELLAHIPDNPHITLAYFNSDPERDLSEPLQTFREVLTTACAKLASSPPTAPPLWLSTTRLDSFGSKRDLRVQRFAIQPLFQWRSTLMQNPAIARRDTLKFYGLYKPHMTIGPIRETRDIPVLSLGTPLLCTQLFVKYYGTEFTFPLATAPKAR